MHVILGIDMYVVNKEESYANTNILIFFCHSKVGFVRHSIKTSVGERILHLRGET